MFLTGDTLSDAIRRVVGGPKVRCAVAFWGEGITEFLRAAGARRTDTQILCDISMGGTSAKALEELGAPGNDQLRRVDGLHAKVYLSDAGMVLGSCNASNNGIGFRGAEPFWIETGTFFEPGTRSWQQASLWFRHLYEDAKVIDDSDVCEAERRHRPPQSVMNLPARPGSLLDIVRDDPDSFGPIGFVFGNVQSTREQRDQARENLLRQEGVDATGVKALPDSGIYTNWTEKDLERWQPLFIDFWISSRDKLYVSGRRVYRPVWENGSVFTNADWRAIRPHLPRRAPERTVIETEDLSIADELIKRAGRGIVYRSSQELSKALIGLSLKS